MKLKFKMGLLTSLGAVAFTPAFACACSQPDAKVITKKTIKYVQGVGYEKDVDTYRVNNDDTICYITLPQYLEMMTSEDTTTLYSYSNGVYIYQRNNQFCKIDTVKDRISFTNPDNFFGRDEFIPFGSDAIPNFQLDEEASEIISFSEKEEGYYKAFHLHLYNFDILDFNNGQDALIPFEPLTYIYATTNLHSMLCYDREKIILTSDFNLGEIIRRAEPTSDIKLLNYNYDCLCFLFDYNYGLKSKRYIKHYDQFFRTTKFKIDNEYMTYYDAFHDTEGNAYPTRALISLIRAECDDGHTSYDYPPCQSFVDIANQALHDYSGERYEKLSELRAYYTEQFNQKKSNYQWIQNPEIEGEYNFMTIVHGDDATKPKAILKFDVFRAEMSKYYKQAQEKFGPDLDFSDIDVLEFFQDSSVLIQFLWADYKIREYNDAHTDAPIEDVVIDLSNNGGGAIVTLAELLAFISNDGVARMSWYDTVNDDYVSSSIKVDTNFDGVYDSNDGYGDEYNFYIVDSGFSFSCGNAMPTFASRNYDIPLIGNRTGGGSCWVCGYMSAPYGDIFNMSSTSNFGFLHNNYFYDIDDGVSPDIQLFQNQYYNYEYISNLIDSMA